VLGSASVETVSWPLMTLLVIVVPLLDRGTSTLWVLDPMFRHDAAER
jgi:hypothetical protein